MSCSWGGCGEIGTCICFAGGMQNGAIAVEKQYGLVLLKLHRITIDVAILAMSPKGVATGTQSSMRTPTSVAARFATAKRWKQSKHPLVREQVNRTR